jgi:hypothetical protein
MSFTPDRQPAISIDRGRIFPRYGAKPHSQLINPASNGRTTALMTIARGVITSSPAIFPVFEQDGAFVIARRQPSEFPTSRRHPGIPSDLTDLHREDPVIV